MPTHSRCRVFIMQLLRRLLQKLVMIGTWVLILSCPVPVLTCLHCLKGCTHHLFTLRWILGRWAPIYMSIDVFASDLSVIWQSWDAASIIILFNSTWGRITITAIPNIFLTNMLLFHIKSCLQLLHRCVGRGRFRRSSLDSGTPLGTSDCLGVWSVSSDNVGLLQTS